MKSLFSVIVIGLTCSVISLEAKVKQGVISKHLIAKYLPENPIIVEAGAHIGTDTIEMSKLWPKGFIFAFEPIPLLFQQLKQRTSKHRNIMCIQRALSNTNGKATMFVSQGNINGSSSLFKPKEHLNVDPTITFPEQTIVETITLDEWAQRLGLQRIDFLWLDMQGAEPIALQASTKILKTVKAIYTEVSFAELYEGIILYPQLKAWLKKQGFKVVQEDRTPQALGKFGNVLFCRID